MAYLELQALSKAYGSSWAVREVSLSILRGEVLSLLGPSGCGKTTTLNMIAGFIRPTSGRIELEGRDLVRVPPNKRDTLMVFQSYALFPHMTVWQNVAFGLEMRKVPPRERDSRVGEGLELVGLNELAHRLPRELSGGQQQRVALARALVAQPKVLLLDEPLSNLDARLRQEMRRELRRIQRATEVTTILVTHDQEEAMTISDRIAVLNAGKVEQVGTAVEIYERPTSVFVADFVGRANIFPAEIVAVEPSRVVARMHGGQNLFARRSCDAHAGDHLALMVRPERMRLTQERTGATNHLAAKIVSVLYLGVTTQVTLCTNGREEPIEVNQPGARDLAWCRPGDQVLVEWEPDDTCAIKL
ncbi:MAG: ABC transporter ATP-binding protein [Chloroflexi bacterium]|nr:ABC transporter ATP-binding protein [Chloroflexota bacterium]